MKPEKERLEEKLFAKFGNKFNKLVMARKALIEKAKKEPKYSTRIIRRCWKCGRKRGYMRDFDLCRICFRELAQRGEIPGVKKSSW
jgi:small subunit ribosomal protein S14